jgi:hypothetical protein
MFGCRVVIWLGLTINLLTKRNNVSTAANMIVFVRRIHSRRIMQFHMTNMDILMINLLPFYTSQHGLAHFNRML